MPHLEEVFDPVVVVAQVSQESEVEVAVESEWEEKAYNEGLQQRVLNQFHALSAIACQS